MIRQRYSPIRLLVAVLATLPAASMSAAQPAPLQHLLPSPDTVPTRYTWVVSGRTVVGDQGPQHSRDVRIAGVKIWDQMLTDAVLRIDQRGVATLRYHSGISFRDPLLAAADLKQPNEYLKYAWDLLFPSATVPATKQILANLYLPADGWSIPVRCPETAQLQQVRVQFSTRALHPGMNAILTASSEPFGAGEITGVVVVGPESDTIMPELPRLPAVGCYVPYAWRGQEVTIDAPPAHDLYLTFSSTRSRRPVLIGGVSLVARLQYAQPPLPLAGETPWQESAAGSGQTDLRLEAHAGRTIFAAAGDSVLQASGDCLIEPPATVAVGGISQPAQKVQVIYTPTSQKRAFVRFPLPGNLRKSAYEAMELRFHTPPGTPARDLRLMVISIGRVDGERVRQVGLWQGDSGSMNGWATARVAFPEDEPDGTITEVSFGRYYARKWLPDDQIDIWLRDLVLIPREAADEEEDIAEAPVAEQSEVSVARLQTLKTRVEQLLALEFPPRSEAFWSTPARSFAPLGIWFQADWGALANQLEISPWLLLEAQLRELRSLNVDCLAANGLKVTNHESLTRLIDVAEKVGVRLVPYEVYIHSQGSAEATARYYTEILRGRVQAMHQGSTANRNGILAWMMTEEIGEEIVPALADYVNDLRRLDPHRPVTICSNKTAAGERFAAMYQPPIVLCDRYPYRWTWPYPLKGIESFVREHLRGQLPHDGTVWMVYQAYRHSLWTPGGNRFDARYMADPAQIRAQIWAYLASGATGGFAFTYNFIGLGHAKTSWTVLKDEAAQPTAFAQALADTYGRLQPFKRLIGSWQPVGEPVVLPATDVEAGNRWPVVASGFQRAGVSGKFWVLANHDHSAAQTVNCGPLGGAAVDLLQSSVTSANAPLTLAAGDGSILYVGPERDRVQTIDWSLAGTGPNP